MAIVACKCPLSLFDNHLMKQYLKLLDRKHSSPHRIERLRIIQVIMDGVKLELARIMDVSFPFISYIYQFFVW